jgi:hypothetical protein
MGYRLDYVSIESLKNCFLTFYYYFDRDHEDIEE